jgi:hypothetical protein
MKIHSARTELAENHRPGSLVDRGERWAKLYEEIVVKGSR